MNRFDLVIIGAGIAGASVAALVAPLRKVLVLEGEDQPGYHTTGRSNAFWQATYGGPHIEPLTTASRAVLEAPPMAFSETGFLRQRGCVTLARRGEDASLAAFADAFAGSNVVLERWNRARLEALFPALKPAWDHGLYEAACFDIDVAALHGAYLKAARKAGADIRSHARVTALSHDGVAWQVEAGGETASAPVIVNAAGAWADDIAALAGVQPVGIQPYRRTIVQLETVTPVPNDLPMLIDVDGGFYFKADGGRIWLSPHDETPSPACDAAPEELDIAIAIDRFEQVIDWPIRRVDTSWAGLRSFAPDRLPVYGFDPASPGFFWCAGQGGFGIQTAPAAADLCARLILGKDAGLVDPTPYMPERFA